MLCNHHFNSEMAPQIKKLKIKTYKTKARILVPTAKLNNKQNKTTKCFILKPY